MHPRMSEVSSIRYLVVGMVGNGDHTTILIVSKVFVESDSAVDELNGEEDGP